MPDYSMAIAAVGWLAVLGACVGLGVAMSGMHGGDDLAGGGGSSFGDDGDLDLDDDAQGGLWG